MSTATAPTTIVHPPDAALRSALQLATVFALARLLFQFALTLYSSRLGYGYFRDEFYYIACGRHLAWGYVDHGPIVALQARLGELLFGHSVFAIRILSALAGALTIFLTGILAWAFGGRRPAQGLAMLCVFLAPEYIGLDGYLSMNSWEPVFWMTSLLALVCVQHGRSPRFWWTIFGISSGIGLLNKPSMLFFLACLGIGLLCTPQRRLLYTRWTAFGIALAVLITVPNVLWQMHNHWPTLEFLRNGQIKGKNLALGPLDFLVAQIMQMHPITSLVWIIGLIALLRARSIRQMHWLGVAYLVFLPLMWKFHAKDYYLAPFYPALFAAGSIAWEHRFRTTRLVVQDRAFAFPALESIIAILTLFAIPMASPILKPDTWLRYANSVHFHPQNTESGRPSILPQFFSDRFGWHEIVRKVDAAYHSLPPQERAEACILTQNYGEAGALNFFNPVLDPTVPAAISGHNNYWLWGPHGCTRNVVVLISGDQPEELSRYYRDVQIVAHIDEPLAMSYERNNVYILRNPRAPLHWKDIKNFF